jgi:hypothetical protein
MIGAETPPPKRLRAHRCLPKAKAAISLQDELPNRRDETLLHHSTKLEYSTAVRAGSNDRVPSQPPLVVLRSRRLRINTRRGRMRHLPHRSSRPSPTKIPLEENPPMKENVCSVPTSLP